MQYNHGPIASVSVGMKENVAYGSAAGSIHKAIHTSGNIAYSHCTHY